MPPSKTSSFSLAFALAIMCSAAPMTSLASEAMDRIDQLKVLIANRKFRSAQTLCNELLHLFPSDARLRYLSGKINQEEGDFFQAEAEFQRSYDLNPQDSLPLIALSELCLSNLELDKSMTYAYQAVATNPDSLPARLCLVKILLRAEQLSEADRQLNYLFEREEKGPDVLVLAFELNRKKGDLRSAQKYLAMALNSKAKSGASLDDDRAKDELYLELAEVLEESGELKQALHILNELVDRRADFAQARLRLARHLEIYERAYGPALTNYAEVLVIEPGQAEAQAGIDRCRAKRNDLALRIKEGLKALAKQWKKSPI